jgi:hypothetical protein
MKGEGIPDKIYKKRQNRGSILTEGGGYRAILTEGGGYRGQ